MDLRASWRKNWPELRAAVARGLPGFVLSSRPRPLGRETPAFCYHTVDADTFGEDLAFLRRNGYTTLDAGDLFNHLVRAEPAPPMSVVLTFDDGAVNLYETVFPLLREHAQKAVAFIAPWFHEQLRSGTHGQDDRQRPCTWEELRRMHASGLIDIQSHTFEHRYLPRWPEACDLTGIERRWVERVRGPGLELADDLRLAKAMLEQRLNKKVEHLAFPQFDGTPEAMTVGRACGYRGFWWGVLPGIDVNRPGNNPTRIVRLGGDLLRRLPGQGRISLRQVMAQRYAGARRHGNLQMVSQA